MFFLHRTPPAEICNHRRLENNMLFYYNSLRRCNFFSTGIRCTPIQEKDTSHHPAKPTSAAQTCISCQHLWPSWDVTKFYERVKLLERKSGERAWNMVSKGYQNDKRYCIYNLYSIIVYLTNSYTILLYCKFVMWHIGKTRQMISQPELGKAIQ